MRVERAPSAANTRRFRSPIQAHLEAIHARYAGLHEGQVAAYIPELAKANPDWFAICLATNDGYLYEIGDSRQPFTIQSISKPFVYGLAIEDRGRNTVLKRIGVEPTGDAFNAISLESGSGRPLNPMINAGAIAASSLVAGHSPDDARARLLAVLSTYAGRPLAVDEAVYESERSTGHRNRAIGHMLRNFDIITEDPDSALDLYFRQCSVAVTCRDLAFMAATLANGGVQPLSGERAILATASLFLGGKALSFMHAGLHADELTKLRGFNPYWRLAWNHEWGAHSLMVGTSGMTARLYDDPLDTSEPATLHHTRDLLLDAQYQYLLDPHSVTAQFVIEHSRHTYPAAAAGQSSAFVDAAGNALPASNASDTTRLVRAKLTYVYQAKVGGSVGAFALSGSTNIAAQSSGFSPDTLTITTDPAAAAPSSRVFGNLTGNPATRGVTLEGFWTPVQYARVGIQ